MKNMKKIQNSVLILAIAVFVVSVGLYAYAYLMTRGLIDRTLEARKVLAANALAETQGKEIAALYESTKDKRARLSAYFVTAGNPVDFIRAIESIGESSGASVSISAIRTNPPADPAPVPPERVGKVTASVVIKGSWNQVMKATVLFETLPYLKNISTITMNATDAGEGTAKVHSWQSNFDISVSTL